MKFFHRKKLATLIALALLTTANSADALQREYIYYGDKVIAELQFLSATEGKSSQLAREIGKVAADKTFFDLSADMQSGIKSATTYWTDMLGAGFKNNQPWQIALYGLNNYKNADAGSYSFDANNQALPLQNYVKETLQNGKKLVVITDMSVTEGLLPAADTALSLIEIGRYFGAKRDGADDGYWLDADTVLPTNEQAADLVGTIRHEYGHALGMLITTEEDKTSAIATLLNRTLVRLKYGDATDWNNHLVDQNGNALDKDKYVITGAEFAILQAADAAANPADYFIVDNIDRDGSGKTLDAPTAGKAYFRGANVSAVLDGATFDGVDGLPVNTWEQDEFEGQHIDTPSMMSHRQYRNYTTFMEADLAVMQDIGYTLDRRAYFGRSIYNTGLTATNTQGYFARNADGTAYVAGEYSTVPLGVGLHVYGGENTITQAADILTRGTGAVGVRVDGYENTLTVAGGTAIHADGERGMGLLVSYGRNHEINQSGTVTALGAGGRAAVFDFGSNMLGVIGEYRGSYMRYIRALTAGGEIAWSKNYYTKVMGPQDYSYNSDELDGALVTSYNISGRLEGKAAAVYIGKNAFVQAINVNDGAAISGDIISDWKHFATDGSYDAAGDDSEPLAIQYNGSVYPYWRYIPGLVTNLNINTALSYDGAISGADNMMLNVNNGATIYYAGTANVVNVNVAEGASVVGGSYTVNDMTLTAKSDAAKADAVNTGIFYNHGTISPAAATSNLSINGKLVSDGVLVGIAGGADELAGKITVTGDANVAGSTAVLAGALPGESKEVLTASGSITGELANGSATALTAGTGMLGYYGTIDASAGAAGATAVTAHAVAQNNLGELTPAEATGYEAVSLMATELAGDSRSDELRPIYAMTAESARHTLGRVATNELPGDIAMSTQRSQLTNRLVANRLHSMWKTPVLSQLNTPNIMSGTGFARRAAIDFSSELTLPVSGAVVADNVAIRTAPPAIDTNTWVNITKNWGELAGDANYHGQAISAGYDWASGKNSRSGVFVSYRASSLGAGSSSASLYDTRLGYYTGSQRGAVECSLYADVGWLYSKTARYLYGDLTARGKESSNLYEFGGRIGYDLHHADGRLWHVVPYLAAQGSWLRSRGYTETGAGVLNQQVASDTSRYFGAQLGVSLERPIRNGSLTIDLGLRHAFSGGEVYRSYRYEGATGRSFTMSSSQDTTHGLLSITADTEFARGWHVSANGTLEKGAHDRDISASLALKRMW